VHLGFRAYSCNSCHQAKYIYFSCKSRFCSSCGKKQTDQWVKTALNVLPNTSWQHITFTLPDSLRDFFWCNRHLLGKISPIAANIIMHTARKKNLNVGIFTALHTFGRDIKRNVHIHLSVTLGGLNKLFQWRTTYFHHAAIKSMWRHGIIDLLRTEFKQGNLTLTPEYNTEILFKNLMQDLYKIDWYVQLQIPSKDHKRNIEYLGRYLKRPPLAETRIIGYDGRYVTFKFLDYHTNTIELITMPVFAFIIRLIRHIPDCNFRSIRYYGFLSNRTRSKLLPLVYEAIDQMPPKVIKKISWRAMIWSSFGYDPLACTKCNSTMQLNRVYYGLSPPELLLKMEYIIAYRT